ncbi:hypothetical protein Y032_0308g2049 [Ancylostoma ceylanicum]|nr:hypothetical protein Y032_0308g2049 [Ancylostoma ceylanicum]
MQRLALFSLANVVISRGILCSGHVVIAVNRATAIHFPLRQKQIWKNSVVFLTMLSLWLFFIVTSLPVLIIYHDSPHFFFTAQGILQMSGGIIDEYNSYQSVLISATTVVICSICYISSYQKARKGEHRFTRVEKRLLLCAFASSVPFCFELIRSILVLLSFRLKNDLYRCVTELWRRSSSTIPYRSDRNSSQVKAVISERAYPNLDRILRDREEVL